MESPSSSAAVAHSIASVVEARTEYSGHSLGLITLVSPLDDADSFLKWSAEKEKGAWTVDKGAKNPLVGRITRRGRLEDRFVRVLDLTERGVLLCGEAYSPPKAAWHAGAHMEDTLNGHFEDTVSSHGRQPALHGIKGCENMCLSVLPSSSGGYMLSPESLPRHMVLKLCLHKSRWRDRIVLEEGMELEIGTLEATKCRMSVMSICGVDPNLARSTALYARESGGAADGDAGGSAGATTTKRGKGKRKSAGRGEGKSKGKGRGADGGDADDEADNNKNTKAAESSAKKRLNKKKVVSFGGTTSGPESGEQLAVLGSPVASSPGQVTPCEPVDVMARSHIWSEAEPEPASRSSVDAGHLSPPPKLVFRIQVGTDKPRVVSFEPDALWQTPHSAKAENQRQSLRVARRAAQAQRKTVFTVGGGAECDMVLPQCPQKVVATIVAFENVFTLLSSSGLSKHYRRNEKLTPTEQVYARMTSVHLLLDSERSFGMYDGDALVLESRQHGQLDMSAPSSSCCTGAELYFGLYDPTEGFRMKRNRLLLDTNGVKTDPIHVLGSSTEYWLSKVAMVFNQGKRQPGRQELTDLGVEVRAPVRTSYWDGSNEWRYGKTEAFQLEGISAEEEAGIGSTQSMTVSIKDWRMGRCHAIIYRKAKKGFCMEAGKASGRKSILRLVAASVPPGLGAASTPPHLLLQGEVFRMGASEFKVLGFTKRPPAKDDGAANERGRSSTSSRATGAGSRSGSGVGRGLYMRLGGSRRNNGSKTSSDGGRGSQSTGSADLTQLGEMSELELGELSELDADEVLGTIFDESEHDEYSSSEEEEDESGDGGGGGGGGGRGSRSAGKGKKKVSRPIEMAQLMTSFQVLQNESEAEMKSKMNSPGSIALVRHLPNVDPEEERVVSSYISADNQEISIVNNVDKTFGLARINEYDAVLKAFGLDEGTRPLTFPGLETFMIVQGIKGPLQRRIFLIDNKTDCTIGSSPTCSISIPNDPLLSPLHCRIRFTPENHWRLVDCSSRTGTFQRTILDDGSIMLQPGQRFLMGHSQLRIIAKVRPQKVKVKRSAARARERARAARRRIKGGTLTLVKRSFKLSGS